MSRMNEAPGLIYVLVSEGDWERFQDKAEFTAPSLASQGFLHASQSMEQLLWVANRRFLQEAKVLALCIDEVRVGPEIRYEDAGQPQPFPHIVGPLNTDAIVEVRELRREETGRFVGF